MAENPVILMAKQAAILARIERQEHNLERIKLANSQFYHSQATDIVLTSVPLKPKPAFNPAENKRPYLLIGKSVKVVSRTNDGTNRAEGYRYIHQTFRVDLAVLYSVIPMVAFDGSRVH